MYELTLTYCRGPTIPANGAARISPIDLRSRLGAFSFRL
jgi:hypothetical protein